MSFTSSGRRRMLLEDPHGHNNVPFPQDRGVGVRDQGSVGPGSGVRGSGIRSGDGDGRVRGGAGGAPGTIRGGGVSKSATKASRDGIGGEKEYGITTFFFRRFSGVEVFVADLDNPRRHEPPGGAPRAGRQPLWACRRPDGPAGRVRLLVWWQFPRALGVEGARRPVRAAGIVGAPVLRPRFTKECTHDARHEPVCRVHADPGSPGRPGSGSR